MRILVVADGYPPDDRNVADLACREIVEELNSRGHDVLVLCGGPRRKKPRENDRIRRWLVRDRAEAGSWQDVFRKEVVNQYALRILAGDFQPEIALFFDLSRISASLPLLAGDMGIPVCLHVAGDSLAIWEADRWFREQPKGPGGYRAMRYLSRRFDILAFSRPLHDAPVIFTSRYLQAAAAQVGKVSPRPVVIPWGIDLRRFPFKETAGSLSHRLLYVGPIGPQRGIETAIDALGVLKRDSRFAAATLTIAGPFPGSLDYIDSLQNRAAAFGIPRDISFTDYSPDRPSPDLYRAHDLFVFPSARVEPMTIPLLEAMACGLRIVATASGGNAEILENEVNALVIPRENPDLCAQSCRRLFDDPALFKTLGAGARRTVEERFSLEKSVDAIESVLLEIAGQVGADHQSGMTAARALSPERDGLRSLMDVSLRANGRLWASSLLVRARNMVKPATVKIRLKDRIKDNSVRLTLLYFPPIFKWYHKHFGLRRFRAGADASFPREILVVQLADLGDIILSGPFLRNLRTLMPRSRIVLAIHPGMLNAAEKCPDVDEIIVFNWRTFGDWKNSFHGNIRWWLRGFVMAVRTFSKHRFDLAVSLRWNDDAAQAASLILMTASGAPRRVAYIDSLNSYKLYCRNNVNHLITEGPARSAPKHEIEYQMDLLRFLGGRPEEPVLKAWTTPEDERVARDLLTGNKIEPGDLLIAMAPGAAWEFRRWPVERFVELGRWLQESYGAKILLLAGKSERPLVAEIEKGLLPGRTVNLAGRTTIREMAAVLKSCRYFIGNDSGPMHVAVAAGVSAVGLFGPGDYVRFRPWGPDNEVIHLGLTCNPCSEICLFSEARCVRGITVKQVKDVFEKKLAARSAK